MATRAIGRPRADWRAALRRSLRRSAQLAGAAALFALMAMLAISIATYHQTDASPSTAAAGLAYGNWLGAPGAWLADRTLFWFGLPGLLALPLLYLLARRLWADAESEDALPALHWKRATAMLLAAIALLGTLLALAVPGPGGNLPASMGGFLGLLGAHGITALAALLPDLARGWAIAAAALVCLIGGVMLVTRVFAFDWGWLRALPRRADRPAADPADGSAKNADPAAFAEPIPRPKRRRAEPDEPIVLPERRAPEITDPSAAPRPAAAPREQQRDMFAPFELPSVDLLEDAPPNTAPRVDKLALERNARLLETVLDDFNVKGEITAVRTGPVVTMYELEPAPGIKASRVIGLAEDIARNMSAVSARVSTIPGKTVMGIELPNADRQMVALKELMACAAYAEAKGNLPIILGKDIAGDPVVTDLAAMPHLLVAGTTGSGKSVGLNCILLSLLYRFTPRELRMILVDPKVLELASYEHIPHLLSPVVTEPPKAIRALKWAVEEMERRYRMMADIGARNITGFNERIRAAIAKGAPLGRKVQTGFDPDTGDMIEEEEQLDYKELPQIVVIVDELADLMLTAGKEIEQLIQRLTQKSRAAGIHLIVATQRPSVDVITGVIKSNIPTRISFQVTSRIDSRTILGDQSGAEQLLGRGDMLFKPTAGALKRVHGPFVSDEEVEAVTSHWREQGAPEYVDSVTEEPADGYGGGFGDDEVTASDSPKERQFLQAVQIVCEGQKASASWIQRRMGIGYNTAAKLIERMEEEGIVGPANHVGRRDVYRDENGGPL